VASAQNDEVRAVLGVDQATEARRDDDFNRGWREGQAALQRDFQGQFGVVRSVARVLWDHLDEAGRHLLTQRGLAPEGLVEASTAPAGPVTQWAIVGDAEQDDDGTPLWWSGDVGWVGRQDAELFTAEEREQLRLPIGGRWVAVE
jgi:hypothetical protein